MIRSTFRTRLPRLAAAAVLAGTLSLHAQEANPTSVPAPQGGVVTQNGDVFFYKVQVVQRDLAPRVGARREVDQPGRTRDQKSSSVPSRGSMRRWSVVS